MKLFKTELFTSPLVHHPTLSQVFSSALVRHPTLSQVFSSATCSWTLCVFYP